MTVHSNLDRYFYRDARTPPKEMSRADKDSFVAWLATKPASEGYDYIDNEGCLIVQFLKACGFEGVMVTTALFWHSGLPGRALPKDLDAISAGLPRTFGGALRRAKKAFEIRR